MRALPAVSLEYFGFTADGNTAGPDGAAGAAAGAASFLASFGAAGAGVAAGVAAGAAAGVAVASAPHWALRKSFHFWPLSVPAVLAAWYFALHSCAVRACAGADAVSMAKPDTAAAHSRANFVVVILFLPGNNVGAHPKTQLAARKPALRRLRAKLSASLR